MISRLINLSESLGNSSSALLLGARGMGKTRLSTGWIATQPYALTYDLLNPEDLQRLIVRPESLLGEVEAKLTTLPPHGRLSVFIDEVQKVPALLDVVHLLIERYKERVRFLLTGSSARKLRSKGTNLLASRALSMRLHPFTIYELQHRSSELAELLSHGSIPAIIETERRDEALRSYVNTYLKEEIQQEALVRKLDKFFSFIDIAAQLNGEVVNHSRIARQLGVADKTVTDYFQILVDTLLMLRLPGWDRSARKQVIKSPKYYFFDCGVLNAAARELNLRLEAGSSRFGRLFETFIINEFARINDYLSLDYQLSFFSTGNTEVDLVLSRSRSEPPMAIEVKSTQLVFREDLQGLATFANEYPESKLYCVCTASKRYKLALSGGHEVLVLPYKEGIAEILNAQTKMEILLAKPLSSSEA